MNHENAEQANTGELGAPNLNFSYREGTIYPREHALWEPQRMDVPLDNIGPDRQRTLAFDFTATITDYEQQPFVETADHNVIAFSGVSIFELAQ